MRFLLLFCLAFHAVASSPIEKALFYLDSSKDKSFYLWNVGEDNFTQENLFIVQVLNKQKHAKASEMLNLASVGIQNYWLNKQDFSTQDQALKLVLLEGESEQQALISYRNSDGAWGSSKEKQSNALDSLLAARSLYLTDYEFSETELTKLINCFLAFRNDKGLWSLSDEKSLSELELSARILNLLSDLRSQASNNLNLLNLITSVGAKLKTSKQSNAYFELNKNYQENSLISTSEAYKALLKNAQPGLFAETLQLFYSKQNENGSWTESRRQNVSDSYTTASVLEALSTVKEESSLQLADLAFYPSSLSFQPQEISLGSTVTLNAVLFNKGQSFASNFKVAFYKGNPALGGTLIEEKTVSEPLLPETSTKISVQYQVSDLTKSPWVYVVVNASRVVNELSYSNNASSKLLSIEGLLAEEDLTEGFDLALNEKNLFFNSQSSDTILLAGSPYVFVKTLIQNLGKEDSPEQTLIVKDGSAVIYESAIPSIAGGASQEISFPWLPSSGSHNLKLSIQSTSEAVDSNLANNTLDYTVNVIGDSVAVIAKRFVDGQELDPPLFPFETARFSVASAYEDAVVSLKVKAQGSDQTLTVPVATTLPGKYEWRSSNATAGTYKVYAQFYSKEDGTLLDETTDTFEIKESLSLRNLKLYLSKNIVEGGVIKPLEMTVKLDNGSNADSTWQLSWALTDPYNKEVKTSSKTEAYYLKASQLSSTFALEENLTGTYTVPGKYTLTVTAKSGEIEKTASAQFNILPVLHLMVKNEAQPAELSPLGKARVKTKLVLTATGDVSNLNLPVSIGKIDFSTEEDLFDKDDAEVTLTLSEIKNAIGELVPDGTPLLAYVPYGSVAEGVIPDDIKEETEDNQFVPQTKILRVKDEKIVFTYKPRGFVLNSGTRGVTVIQFHQYLEDKLGEEQRKWFGLNIGNAEIFLKSGK